MSGDTGPIDKMWVFQRHHHGSLGPLIECPTTNVGHPDIAS
jgi:hypothetical protein